MNDNRNLEIKNEKVCGDSINGLATHITNNSSKPKIKNNSSKNKKN